MDYDSVRQKIGIMNFLSASAEVFNFELLPNEIQEREDIGF
jgi:hypothetical protein